MCYIQLHASFIYYPIQTFDFSKFKGPNLNANLSPPPNKKNP